MTFEEFYAGLLTGLAIGLTGFALRRPARGDFVMVFQFLTGQLSGTE